jgi:hypothetical protein
MAAKHPINFRTLLKQVNAIRVACEIGDSLSEMPKGHRSNETECPIARALSNGMIAEVSSEITLTAKGDPSRYDFKAIAKALRAAGFRKVTIETREAKDAEGNYIYDLSEDYVMQDYGIAFLASQTMDNFINRFDAGEITSLIEGWTPGQDDDEDDDA